MVMFLRRIGTIGLLFSGLVLGLCVSSAGWADETPRPVDIADQLAAIEGLIVEEVTEDPEGHRLFMLYFDQPADHSFPDGERFSQRLFLLHLDSDAPMVFHTQGYGLSTAPYPYAMPYPMPANELRVEHRFFN